MAKTKVFDGVAPAVGLDVAAAIEKLNLAVVDVLIACASSGDPLAHLLLGVDKEVLDEFRDCNIKSDFMKPSRIGGTSIDTPWLTGSISLVKLRFNKASTWRALRNGGFASAVVLRELTKDSDFGGEHF